MPKDGWTSIHAGEERAGNRLGVGTVFASNEGRRGAERGDSRSRHARQSGVGPCAGPEAWPSLDGCPRTGLALKIIAPPGCKAGLADPFAEFHPVHMPRPRSLITGFLRLRAQLGRLVRVPRACTTHLGTRSLVRLCCGVDRVHRGTALPADRCMARPARTAPRGTRSRPRVSRLERAAVGKRCCRGHSGPRVPGAAARGDLRAAFGPAGTGRAADRARSSSPVAAAGPALSRTTAATAARWADRHRGPKG